MADLRGVTGAPPSPAWDEPPPPPPSWESGERDGAAPAFRGWGSAVAVSVSDLTRRISALVASDDSLKDIWVRGEVSGARRPASGHIYFDLKDAGAVLHCVCFRNEALRVPFRVENGMSVFAHGRINIYSAQGTYQLVVDTLEPDGVGAQHLAFEQTRARLLAEGLLSEERKRPLPAFPLRVALITSLTGAVVHDMCRMFREGASPPDLVLVDAQTQGEGAVPALIAALDLANRESGADLIVLARGGGSMEDLQPFNDERLARAVAASRLPVVTGIGHETDTTLADLAADHRAATPTHAARLIRERREALLRRIDQARERAGRIVEGRLRTEAMRLRHLGERGYLSRPELLLERPTARVDRLRERLVHHMALRLAGQRERLQALGSRAALSQPELMVRTREQRLDALLPRLQQSLADRVTAAGGRISVLKGKLDSLSPLATLQRGYALVSKGADGRPVRSVADVRHGDEVRVRLADGSFVSWVLTTESGNGGGEGKRKRRA